eukprot:3328940-Rhodomonas_salina.1
MPARASAPQVLREIIRRLPKATTFVTASTGVAACNVNGSTLHHFAGLGRGDQPVEKTAAFVSRSDAGERWRRAKTLVCALSAVSYTHLTLPTICSV